MEQAERLAVRASHWLDVPAANRLAEFGQRLGGERQVVCCRSALGGGPVSDSRHIEYELTREDYIRCAHEETRAEHSPDWARFYRQRTWMLAASICSTALYALMLYTNFRGAIDPGNGLVLSLGAGVAYLWWWTVGAFRATTRAAMHRQLEALADSSDARRALGLHRVTLTPTDVQWESKGVRWASPWSQVLTVTDAGSFVYVTTHAGGGILIPKRIFASEDAINDFVQTARRFHAAAPSGPVEVLREFLSARDVPCPTCGYNLRGLQTDRCPECSTHLSAERLTPSTSNSAADRGQSG